MSLTPVPIVSLVVDGNASRHEFMGAHLMLLGFAQRRRAHFYSGQNPHPYRTVDI